MKTQFLKCLEKTEKLPKGKKSFHDTDALRAIKNRDIYIPLIGISLLISLVLTYVYDANAYAIGGRGFFKLFDSVFGSI